MDKGSDAIFYDQPRFVAHIDDYAIESLTKYYADHLGTIHKFCCTKMKFLIVCKCG